MQLCCLTGCSEKVVKSEQEDWIMAKFDSDFSIFGTLAGDIVGGVPIEKMRVDYVNNACVNLLTTIWSAVSLKMVTIE